LRVARRRQREGRRPAGRTEGDLGVGGDDDGGRDQRAGERAGKAGRVGGLVDYCGELKA